MGDLVKYGRADLSYGGVQVYGIRELARDAKRVGVDVEDLKDLMHRLGLPIARLASYLAPKDTGRLARQIKSAKRRDRVLVSVGGARLPYAGRRHWGDPGTTGPQFLSRAEELMRPRTIDRLGDGIMQLLRKHDF